MKGLLETRIERGYTRKQVELLTGISLSNQSLCERGVQAPDLKTRARLELFFDTAINWLDTPFINSEPREIPNNWNDAEREFRYFIHMIASLQLDERKAFIISIVKHINKLKK